MRISDDAIEASDGRMWSDSILEYLRSDTILTPGGGLFFGGTDPGTGMGELSEALTDRYLLMEAGAATFGAMPTTFIYDGHPISRGASGNGGIIRTSNFVRPYEMSTDTGHTPYFRTYGFDKTTLFEFMTSISFQNEIEDVYDADGIEGVMDFVSGAITTAVDDFREELDQRPDGLMLGCTAYYGYHFADSSTESIANPDVMYSETVFFMKERLANQMPLPNFDSPYYSGHSGDDGYTLSEQVYQGMGYWNSNEPYGEPVKLKQKFGWTDGSLKRKDGCKSVISAKITNIINDLEQGVLKRMDVSKTTNRLNVTRNMFEKIIDDGKIPIVDIINGTPNIASITNVYTTAGKLVRSYYGEDKGIGPDSTGVSPGGTGGSSGGGGYGGSTSGIGGSSGGGIGSGIGDGIGGGGLGGSSGGGGLGGGLGGGKVGGSSGGGGRGY